MFKKIFFYFLFFLENKIVGLDITNGMYFFFRKALQNYNIHIVLEAIKAYYTYLLHMFLPIVGMYKICLQIRQFICMYIHIYLKYSTS